MSSGDARRALMPVAELERLPGGNAIAGWVARCAVIRAGGTCVPPAEFALVVDEAGLIAGGQGGRARGARAVLADLIAQCRTGGRP